MAGTSLALISGRNSWGKIVWSVESAVEGLAQRPAGNLGASECLVDLAGAQR